MYLNTDSLEPDRPS